MKTIGQKKCLKDPKCILLKTTNAIKNVKILLRAAGYFSWMV